MLHNTTALRSWTLVFHEKLPRSNTEERGTFGLPLETQRKIRFARQGERARIKKSAYMQVRMHDIPKLARIRISATFFRRAMGVADYDGDVFGLKHLLDGIVSAGVVPNDSRRYVQWGDVTEERGRPYRVELTIEELEAV